MGVCYARLWMKGKEVRHSLKIKDRELAKRRLADKRNELKKINWGGVFAILLSVA